MSSSSDSGVIMCAHSVHMGATRKSKVDIFTYIRCDPLICGGFVCFVFSSSSCLEYHAHKVYIEHCFDHSPSSSTHTWSSFILMHPEIVFHQVRSSCPDAFNTHYYYASGDS